MNEQTEIQITVEDFDKAMSQRWSVQTCVLAQTAIRYGFKDKEGDPGDPNASLIMGASTQARRVATIFDQERGVCQRGLEGSPRLRWLREALPIKVSIPARI